MPIFYRHRSGDYPDNVVAVRIFTLPEGLACIVSWPLPEPGLRIFSPTTSRTEGPSTGLPYAIHLSQRLGTPRVTIELDEGIEWDPDWGELAD